MTTSKTTSPRKPKLCQELSADGAPCEREGGANHGRQHSMRRPDGTIHYWGRTSGPTKTHAARKADGEVRVEVYLTPEEVAVLAALTVSLGSKRDAIGAALLAYKGHK